MKSTLFPALTPSFAALAPPDSARAGNDLAASRVMEIVSFRLTDGCATDSFLTAAMATEAPLRRQPGFLRRTLVLGADGTWTDLVEWSSITTAHAGAQAMMAEPAFQPFMAMIDMASVTMGHPAILFRMD